MALKDQIEKQAADDAKGKSAAQIADMIAAAQAIINSNAALASSLEVACNQGVSEACDERTKALNRATAARIRKRALVAIQASGGGNLGDATDELVDGAKDAAGNFFDTITDTVGGLAGDLLDGLSGGGDNSNNTGTGGGGGSTGGGGGGGSSSPPSDNNNTGGALSTGGAGQLAQLGEYAAPIAGGLALGGVAVGAFHFREKIAAFLRRIKP